jgi:hypothetical protein
MPRRPLRLALATCASVLCVAAPAPAATIDGSPLNVFVGTTGRLSAQFDGSATNLFFPPTSPDGDAGLTLASADPAFSVAFGGFTAVGSQTQQGDGSAANPFVVDTIYSTGGSVPIMTVNQRVTYVNGQSSFGVTYALRSQGQVTVRATVSGNLFVGGSDAGTGRLVAAPPRTVLGVNPLTGATGGLAEVATTPWDAFQEGDATLVNRTIPNSTTLPYSNAVDPSNVDNAVGAYWVRTPSVEIPTVLSATWTFSPPSSGGPLPNDADGDGVPDTTDNCDTTPNPNQADKDQDGIGDACDDNDGSRPPVPFKSVQARVISGEVFYKPPAGRLAQAPPGFLPLLGAAILPVGSIVETANGRVELTAAAATSGSKTMKAQFFEGRFQIKQVRQGRRGAARRQLFTQLPLQGGDFRKVCGRSSRALAAQRKKRSKKKVRHLWGDGKGDFQTRGRGAAATVRGTIWLTEDRCDGTLVRVRRGRVAVRDLRLRKTIIVRAGQSYVAKLP